MIYLLIILALILIVFSWFKPKWAFWLLLALIPFHAFLVTAGSHFLNLTPTQQTIFASWKEIILAVLIIKVIWQAVSKTKKFPFKILLVDKLIFALFVLAALSIPFLTKDLSIAFWGLRYDFELFLIYFVVRSFEWKKIEIQKSVAIILIAGLVVALFAILQVTVLPKDFLTQFGYSTEVTWQPGQSLPAFQQIGGTEVVRAQSFLAGPNQLGSYLLILLPLALLMIFYQKAKKAKLIFSIYFIIFLLALFFTYSRSAWLGFLAAVLVLIFILINRKFRLYFLGGLILIGLAVYLISKNLLSFRIIDVFVQHQGSTPERIETLKKTFGIILKNPFGLGVGKAGLVSFTSQKADTLIPESWYLQVALEFGILGFLIYVGIVVEFFRNLWRKFTQAKDQFYKILSFGTFLAFTGFAVYSLFLHTWSDISTTLTFWILMGLTFSSLTLNTNN